MSDIPSHQLGNTDVIPEDLSRIAVSTKVQLVLGTNADAASVFQNHATRNPGLVFRLSSDLLVRHAGSMSEMERYCIYEAGAQAALDLGQDNIAAEWVMQLSKRFGKMSPRVLRLRGLYEEATGDTARALAIYEKARTEFPLDMWPVKRSAAIHKSAGRIREAIAVLESRSDVFKDTVENKGYPFRQLHPLDDGTLRELINLHWMADNVQRCVFYAEEMMLLDPHNFLFLSRLGELCYSAGHLERAVSAYAQSVRLNPHACNTRAVLGLWQSALEWRKSNNSNSSSASGRKAVAAASAASSSKRVTEIDGDDVATSATDVVSAADDSSSSHGATTLTLPLVNNLINLAEARLKQHYANSPVWSVMELTMRRCGSSGSR